MTRECAGVSADKLFTRPQTDATSHVAADVDDPILKRASF